MLWLKLKILTFQGTFFWEVVSIEDMLKFTGLYSEQFSTSQPSTIFVHAHLSCHFGRGCTRRCLRSCSKLLYSAYFKRFWPALSGTLFYSYCPLWYICTYELVTLQQFMDTFNDIAHAAHSNDDTFYTQVCFFALAVIITFTTPFANAHLRAIFTTLQSAWNQDSLFRGHQVSMCWPKYLKDFGKNYYGDD